MIPSQARVCFNVIVVPEAGSCKLTKKPKIVGKNKMYQIEGLVLASTSISIFDEEYYLR
jgi:hypothetical protein